jgi:hypothetical protein
MVIDERRDHSIRIPQPDLSIKLGTPNACNQCHGDKSAQWASNAINKWYGHSPSGLQRFAESLHNGAEGAPGAQRALVALALNRGQPSIARATAFRPCCSKPRRSISRFGPRHGRRGYPSFGIAAIAE